MTSRHLLALSPLLLGLTLAACQAQGTSESGGAPAPTEIGQGPTTAFGGTGTAETGPTSETTGTLTAGPTATPGCAPMAEDVKSMLELDLEAKGNKLVEAAAWAYPVPEGVYGVWEMNAVKVEKADGTEAVGSWLSVSFLLDLQWSSTIDQKVKLYAVDDVAGEVSTFGPPDPNELKADVAPDDPTIASAQECLGS